MKTITATVSPAASDASKAERFVLGFLRLYKLLVSPYFAGSCRFLPSCADYAREAVTGHGVARGGWLAVKRVARCHPLCEGGHDPVPAPRISGHR